MTSLAILAVPTSFGHDESVYGACGRSMVLDTLSEGIGPQRAPELPVLAAVILRLEGGDFAMRAAVLFAGIGLIGGTWRLGVRIETEWTGAVAAILVALSPLTQSLSTPFLTDASAAALLTWGALIALEELEERPQLTWRLGLLAVAGAAAFYIRYAAIFTLTLMASAGIALRGRRLRADLGRRALALVFFVVLLLPHGVASLRNYGAPWGAFTAYGDRAAEGAPTLFPLLGGWLVLLPIDLGGPLIGATIIVGCWPASRCDSASAGPS